MQDATEFKKGRHAATCQLDGERLKLIWPAIGAEIIFRHERPDGKAIEHRFRKQLLELTQEHPSLLGMPDISFNGNYRYIRDPNDNNKITAVEYAWDEKFKYTITCRYEAKNEPAPDGMRNVRADCKYMYPDFKTMGLICCQDENNTAPIEAKTCNCCKNYKSRYIDFPITVANIRTRPCDPVNLHKKGMLVAIRPVSEKDNPEQKTYLGIYVGDLPMMLSQSYERDNQILNCSAVSNPAFWVFDLNLLVFGAESWWKRIETPEDMTEISDSMINDQFYVKLLKDLGHAEG